MRDATATFCAYVRGLFQLERASTQANEDVMKCTRPINKSCQAPIMKNHKPKNGSSLPPPTLSRLTEGLLAGRLFG
jgi:hypothetical protein